MKDNLREISAYSSNSGSELSYTQNYWFHNWITPTIALVENEGGELIEASYKEFKFKKLTYDKLRTTKEKDLRSITRLKEFQNGCIIRNNETGNLYKIIHKTNKWTHIIKIDNGALLDFENDFLIKHKPLGIDPTLSDCLQFLQILVADSVMFNDYLKEIIEEWDLSKPLLKEQSQNFIRITNF